MRILAIDPGFERVGIAVLERPDAGTGHEALLYSHCFKTPSTMPFHERLLLIGEEIKRIVAAYSPEILAIEALFLHSNQKTVMRVAEARGVMIHQAAVVGLDVCEYTPLQVKIAVAGYGRANKDQVASMVRQLIKLSDDITSDDEIDAIAIGLTCSASIAARNKGF
ncbi:MAG: crossover junction endodeoxyribonuclease RuvC [Patescibacteria group bacterium]|nr:MAG: crossover junction endodeoxyribonuclease RuvC [Patescibacteria group bacterium]